MQTADHGSQGLTTRFPRSTYVICLLSIALVALVAYANALDNDFVWDDVWLIKENTHIESFSFIPRIFKECLEHTETEPTGYYRPIQSFSYMIDHFLWGKEPFGYHLTNIFIHILNAFLVFFLLMLLIKDPWKSLFVAALFAVHPAFVPIVTYISGRADALGLLFCLATVLVVLRYALGLGRQRIVWLAPIFFALSILSKEYYIITPLFIILFLLTVGKDLHKDKALIVIVAQLIIVVIGYILLRATVLNFHQKMLMSDKTFLERLAVAPYILASYVRTLVLPLELSMEKRLIFASLREPRFVFSCLTPAVFGWLVFHSYRAKDQRALFALGWFLIALMPIMNLLFPLKAIWAEHWTYLPSIGFFIYMLLIFEHVLSRVKDHTHAVRISVFIGAVIIALFCAKTISENRYWKDDMAFFSRTVKASTYSARAKYNLALAYEKSGDHQKALEYYDQAIIACSGKIGSYYHDRGLLRAKMGQADRGLSDLEAALRIDPGNPAYYYSLSQCYERAGDVRKAIDIMTSSLEKFPSRKAEFLSVRGMLCRSLGDLQSSRLDLEAAVRIDPGNTMYHNNLGGIYAELGLPVEARSQWSEALRLDPKSDMVRRNLERLEQP